MSGHSKWNNIKYKKEKTDVARAKIATKISREIYAAVKNGGADVLANRKLKDLIAKAKMNNIPISNVERVIKKAAGDVNKTRYEEVVYEGYGPCGVAILIETLTNNRNRTVSNLRHYLNKFGGKLADSGCVSFMFEDVGFVRAARKNLTEDEAMNDCLDVEANDYEMFVDYVEFFVNVSDLNDVVKRLQDRKYDILLAEKRKIAKSFSRLASDEDAQKFDSLVQILEDDSDVQNVWTNLGD